MPLQDADAKIPATPPAIDWGEPEYISPKTASIRFDFTERALQCMRARGTGPSFVRVGRRIRYRVSDIRAWLQRYRVDV